MEHNCTCTSGLDLKPQMVTADLKVNFLIVFHTLSLSCKLGNTCYIQKLYVQVFVNYQHVCSVLMLL